MLIVELPAWLSDFSQKPKPTDLFWTNNPKI